MQAFVCNECFIAFEIGHYFHSCSIDETDQLVCTTCGTMHRNVYEHVDMFKPELGGITKLFALPRPIDDLKIAPQKWFAGSDQERMVDTYKWPFNNECDWIEFDQQQRKVKFDGIPCNYCQSVGSMISLEYPLSSAGLWPAFRVADDTYVCPLCSSPKVELLYITN